MGSQEVRRTIIGRNVVKPFMCYFEYGRFLNIVKLLGIPCRDSGVLFHDLQEEFTPPQWVPFHLVLKTNCHSSPPGHGTLVAQSNSNPQGRDSASVTKRPSVLLLENNKADFCSNRHTKVSGWCTQGAHLQPGMQVPLQGSCCESGSPRITEPGLCWAGSRGTRGGQRQMWVQKWESCWDFPGGPVAKTLHSQCRGPRFDPWSGN